MIMIMVNMVNVLYFQKKEGKINFLVNGVNEKLYYQCSISREMNDMCGEEGKYYKNKIIKTEK